MSWLVMPGRLPSCAAWIDQHELMPRPLANADAATGMLEAMNYRVVGADTVAHQNSRVMT
jgi:hypothetical protein